MQLDDIVRALANANPDMSALEQSILDETQDQIWFPNPGPQTDAYYSEADELFYGGSAGGGKALSVHSKVLTPFGWRAMGSVRVGDRICGTDGTVQEVINVFPQGVRPLFRVTFRDGGSVLADLEHNWLAWRTHKGTRKKGELTQGPDAARKWTTRQMLAEMDTPWGKDGRLRGFAIPVTKPVAFNVAGSLKGRGRFVKRDIDPYLLGLLIGDGCITESNISLTTIDVEIAESFSDMVGGTSQNKITYYPKGLSLVGLRQNLSALGLLGRKSNDKFIPRQYLYAPIPDRWALLQGLMDTDGWVEEKRALYYVSVSSQLADDVEHLARSLGAVTTRTCKQPTYTYKGATLSGQEAYCVRMKFPQPELAFRLTRKRNIARSITHQSISRVVESIEYELDDEAVCITVSNPNSLYITDDFIVTHNTELILGLALTQHRKSLILRRTNTEVNGLAQRLEELVGNRDGFNSQSGVWRRPDGRLITLGGCQLEEDKQKRKGNPHDFYGFDEVSDFTKTQYRFIIGWNRSTHPDQRCRVVCAGNPPTRPEGQWVVEHWAPWLDPQHPNPAEPGELRWFTTGPNGEDIEVDGPGPHYLEGNGGKPVYARSRTFIPAVLDDNPDLADTDYKSTLDSLPIELRRAYRDGDFGTALEDDAYQIIPTDWVVQAQQRWQPVRPAGVPMCAIGVDVAIAKDNIVIAPRYDGWYSKLLKVPGREIPDPKQVAGRVIAMRHDMAKVIVDVGGGWGADCYAQLLANNIDAVSYMGVKPSRRKSVDGSFSFYNTRTEALWRFREALDPTQPGGSVICLPPGTSIKADLCAPKYEVRRHKGGQIIQAESKEDVCKRLGRSTDEGDAIIMAWWHGPKQENVGGGWAVHEARRQQPAVNRGNRYRR